MIPFSPPRIDQKIIDEVTDTLKSGWITTGKKTKLFEKKITKYCGCGSTICVSSATAGLELVLRWFGVGEGDEVILPAYTYCATANVIVHCGAKPVFVDINPRDFNINLKQITRAITSKTKVIMPVDMAGFPCDYDEINSLVRQEEIKKLFTPNNENQKRLGRMLVLSDSAHSFGAFYKNRRSGSLTDVSVFSFHAIKNLTTAEGGSICFNLPEPFNNDEIYKYFNIFILHGQNKDALAKTQSGNWKYDVIEAGFKANMTDIHASIGLVEIDRYDEETLVKRRSIFDRYNERLSKYSWAELPVFDENEKVSSYHVYLLKIKKVTEEQRDRIMQGIFARDVSVNVHFRPVPSLLFYKNMGYKMEYFPVSYDNFSREITLPVYFDLSQEQVNTVINAVIDSVREVINL